MLRYLLISERILYLLPIGSVMNHLISRSSIIPVSAEQKKRGQFPVFQGF